MTVSAIHHQDRFNWVTSGADRGPDPAFDVALFSSAAAVAIPSKGSLVPGWTLVVPRQRSLSFRKLLDRSPAISFVYDVARVVSSRFPGRTFIFEHGPSLRGTLFGCGVDHAHVHVVPLPFDLIDSMRDLGTATCTYDTAPADPWADIDDHSPYWLAVDPRNGRRLVVQPTHEVSQGIRRLIAKQLGVEGDWDYRAHPYIKNAQITIERIGQAIRDTPCA